MFRVCGYDFMRYTSENFVSVSRAKILQTYNIDLVLDIGANEGQYPLELRENGYHGSIISFEPLSQSFSILQRQSAGDPHWRCENIAVGDTDGTIIINISGHKTSSSILPMSETHARAVSNSNYIGSENVRISRLDSLNTLIDPYERLYLKVDVQGYEKNVLLGAAEILKRTYAIELELSLSSMYKGGALMNEMLEHLYDMGFKMASLKPIFFDPETGIVLQADGIFIK